MKEILFPHLHLPILVSGSHDNIQQLHILFILFPFLLWTMVNIGFLVSLDGEISPKYVFGMPFTIQMSYFS